MEEELLEKANRELKRVEAALRERLQQLGDELYARRSDFIGNSFCAALLLELSLEVESFAGVHLRPSREERIKEIERLLSALHFLWRVSFWHRDKAYQDFYKTLDKVREELQEILQDYIEAWKKVRAARVRRGLEIAFKQKEESNDL